MDEFTVQRTFEEEWVLNYGAHETAFPTWNRVLVVIIPPGLHGYGDFKPINKHLPLAEQLQT